MGEIVVVRDGSGPEVLLVHGGAGPRTTWRALAPLTDRWTLAYVHRRGYPPSPPPQKHQDFEVDALDLAPLLVGRPHVVAHSCGALGTLIAAAAMPDGVRSLTLIEPPLNYLVAEDPEVARLERIGDAALAYGMDMDPAELREFLQLAGAPSGTARSRRTWSPVFGGRRVPGRPARPAHGSTPSVTAAFRCSSRPEITREGSSGSATLSRRCSAASAVRIRAPVTSSPRHRASPNISRPFCTAAPPNTAVRDRGFVIVG
ncbi:alpha/beta fold hydrolase [Actinomadura sp. KC345]|uniref:alpha/beta fold hydrolase n=1 Tax=Actinomadura sp. KC345 TaxID=2530371 RepID=UPI001A9FA749|nr:alpha/beta fold hydrolase [Actinomadura sp. KC345]